MTHNASNQRMHTTSAQYGIWMAQQMVPQSPSYWTGEAIELQGELNLAALIDTVQEVLHNAHGLHVRFCMDEEGLWQLPQTIAAQLEVFDMRAFADPSQAAFAWMQQSLSQVCDLTRDPLFRTALLQVAEQSYLWFLQVHHIVLDGYGYALVCQTIAQRYSARVQGQALPPLPDWRIEPLVQAEQNYKTNGRYARDKAFWQQHLQQAPALATVAELAEFSDAVLRQEALLDSGAIAHLQSAAQRCGQDWGSWLLAAIGLWLARQSGQHHLTFGLPVMNRLGTPALGVPCMAMNIVPMAVHVSHSASMADMSHQMAQRMREIRPHLYYRYGWIRGDLGLLEVGKHLFNQAVNIMPFDRHAPFAGLQTRLHAISAGPVKDLNISVSVLNQQWRVLLEANPNAYAAERLQALLDDLLTFLHRLATHPQTEALAPLLDDLPALAMVQGADLATAPRPVLARMHAMVERQPERIALEQGDQHWTYQQLWQAVQARAQQLHQAGVVAGDRVVLLLPNGAEAIVALLACVWVGACYVPLDPQGPATRLQVVLEDSQAACTITQRRWSDKLHGHSVLYLDDPVSHPMGQMGEGYATPDAQHPAYLLYTSGSTGKPKGVLVGHGALNHFVASAGGLYRIDAADRVLQFAPLHFDASVEEVFLSLCHGATLVLREDKALDSTAAFIDFVQRQRLTVLDLPTAYWHELAFALEPQQVQALSSVRLTIIGGEAALAERVLRWRALLPAQVLVNSYGPTEASVIATTAVVGGPQAVWSGEGPLPIGLPRPGVVAVVVDEQLHPVAQGQAGELLLCGDALAIGYWQQEGLTQQRFIQGVGTHAMRAYRTGDRVVYRDGQLHFLGRLDDEIKISGVRITPAEVENALLTHAAVREAAVTALPSPGASTKLAAFVVVQQPVSVAQLRSALALLLPMAAIPDLWHFPTELPRNVNGKIDRKRLCEEVQMAHATPPVQANAVEQQILQVWHEVLGTAPADVQAHFFDMGGKSLQAIQVSVRLSRLLQREVPVSALFHYPTVQALAKSLAAPVAHKPQAQWEMQAFSPVLTLQTGSSPGLFCIHPAEGLSWCYGALTRYLPGIAVHGVQAFGELPLHDFAAWVDVYVARIRALQANGPYRLLGWSLGGALAHAMAARLQQLGETVELVAMMDSYPAASFSQWRAPELMDALITLLSVNGEVDAPDAAAVYTRLLQPGSPFAVLGRSGVQAMGERALQAMQLFRQSATPLYHGDVLLFRAKQAAQHAPQAASWQPYVAGEVAVVHLDCNHFGMSDPQPMALIGKTLAARLGCVEEWV
ncbi:amino acid adenylation domain-containing protein [Curvibacter sp. CHRR-16]|uniref:non-ribosomal peptide synthetase n=1 Tax=Curvibacter sp. CHRR-16 TaxID=2835872 RepID=UPI001BD99A05|nr:non-ribosomal peptide synthetase [Curvibacter sp. CHRR-16]MBT0570234.1 amino acid adenylation domain-containing protein [Curvibacter sp. CHRR-16]